MENLSKISITHIALSIGILLLGVLVAKLARLAVTRLSKDTFSLHHTLLLQRLVYYGIVLVFLFTALQQLGINLSVLVGAAGILSVALGFASQTSASNIISGLFLLSEKTFAISDVIKVGSTIGEVISIDLLSVKLRTPDNLFVRIPNETLIKSEVTTITRFPIRRFDLPIGVAYKEDLTKVNQVLLRVAEELNDCLEEPAPQVFNLGFGDSSINLQFSTWAKSEGFMIYKNKLIERIKVAFEREGIEIPYPHQTVINGMTNAQSSSLQTGFGSKTETTPTTPTMPSTPATPHTPYTPDMPPNTTTEPKESVNNIP